MSKITPAKRKGKKRYYKKHQVYNINRHNRYSIKECRMIFEHNVTDVELAKLLRRSLISIQIKRVRLKQQWEENSQDI